jgi:hypothetical protein
LCDISHWEEKAITIDIDQLIRQELRDAGLPDDFKKAPDQ